MNSFNEHQTESIGEMASASDVWRYAVSVLLALGSEVAPFSAGANFKGRTTKELLGFQTLWPMSSPVIRIPQRKMGYRFMAAEAAWILSGDNRLASILPYAKHMKEFTDDGLTLSGAYGPPFVDQAGWCARTLVHDPASRQAVCSIWRPRPGPSNDTPCTVSLQWLIRDKKLHCVATMRSSDTWTGIPYDVFAFSMMSAQVSLMIRDYASKHILETRGKEAPPCFIPLPLGDLHLTAGSQHLYKQDWEEAQACLKAVPLPPVDPIELHDFADAEHLRRHLWACANHHKDTFDRSVSTFLEELMPWHDAQASIM